MSQAAGGTPLTILMMLAEAINDAVTEQWLDFKKMVVMVAVRVWGSSSSICYESVCCAMPSGRPVQQRQRRVMRELI